MEIADTIQTVTDSEAYKSWEKDNQGFYLVHVFYMSGQEPQVGFYSKKTDQIVTFSIGKEVKINPASDVFKDSPTIAKLSMELVKIDKPNAVTNAKELKAVEYPNEIIDKEIMLLQVHDNKHMYNITYFTKSFNTLNIKVDANSGKIIEHKLSSLVSF